MSVALAVCEKLALPCSPVVNGDRNDSCSIAFIGFFDTNGCAFLHAEFPFAPSSVPHRLALGRRGNRLHPKQQHPRRADRQTSGRCTPGTGNVRCCALDDSFGSHEAVAEPAAAAPWSSGKSSQRSFCTVFGLAPHAKVPAKLLAQTVTTLLVSGDCKPHRGGGEGIR